MALFGIDEESKLRKQLTKSTKKGNLAIIGGVLGVLTLIVVFTMTDLGSLFKGFSGGDIGGKSGQCYEAPEFKETFKTTLGLIQLLETTSDPGKEVCKTKADGTEECEIVASEGTVITKQIQVIKELFDPIKALGDSDVQKFTKAVNKIVTEAPSKNCKPDDLTETLSVCQAILNTVESAAYEPANFSQETKEALEKMVNVDLGCPISLGCKPGDEIDFFYQNYQNPFVCSTPTVVLPKITEHKTNIAIFDPSPKWEEHIIISYSVDIHSSVKLEIKNSNGTVVAERDKQIPLHLGDEFKWDGKDKSGKLAYPGTYTYEITAKTEGGTGPTVSGVFDIGDSGYLKYCTGKDGQLSTDSDKLCIDGIWIFCTVEGEKSPGGSLVCTNGKWGEAGGPILKYSTDKGVFNPSTGETITFFYTPDQDATIKLTATSQNGTEVHTFSEEVTKDTPEAHKWDGKILGGTVAPDGLYAYTLQATNAAGLSSSNAGEFSIGVLAGAVPTLTQYIDKTSFDPTKGEKISFVYTPDQSVTIKLKVFNSTNIEVHSFEESVSKDSPEGHAWDGKKADGSFAPPGTYTYNVKAVTSAGAESVASGGGFSIEAKAVAGVDCTEDQLTAGATKLCKGGEWLLCTEGGTFDGEKSTNKKLTCAGGKWIDLSITQPKKKVVTEKTSCVENNLMMSGKRICKGSIWIPCGESNEGEKSSDNLKVCNEGVWKTASRVVKPPASSGEIRITKAKAFPIGFNPLINETKITYAISAQAEIEIKILTKSGVTMATIVDGKVLAAGEYFIWWDGKGNNGKIVNPATYEYKVTAKDPNSGTVKDVKKGKLNVVYAKVADFEVQAPQPPQVVNNQNNQTAATLTINNATSGRTAQTGPGVLLYFLFPVGSFILTRRKK